jgi:hypothetical protein
MILLSGCIVRRTAIPQNQRPFPAQTRSYSEILQVLTTRSQAVKSLKAARVVFRPSAGARRKNELTELRMPVDGYLLINRPNDMHIHLSAPLLKVSLADVVSDGREYRVWSPMNNNFYVGRADEAIQIAKLDLQLPPPNDIANALFVDISPYLDNPAKYRLAQTEAFEARHSYYVMRVLDVEGTTVEAHALEDIWIDRTSMEVVRQVIYGKEGGILTATEFSGFPSSGAAPFPKIVTIRRPVEDIDLTMEFVTAETNAPLPSESFQLLQPPGAELIQVPPSATKHR